MEPIRFETGRLIIRQFCEADTEAYFLLRSTPQVHCFVPDKLNHLEEARREILIRKDQTDGSELAVCRKDTGCFIGTLFGLWAHDTFSVCWNFLSDYCGKGYGYEAAEAYLNFLFYQKNARRIYAYVEESNLPSQHLCQKLGMRQEGLFREFISFVQNPDGSPLYENTMQFAILKKEWDLSRP